MVRVLGKVIISILQLVGIGITWACYVVLGQMFNELSYILVSHYKKTSLFCDSLKMMLYDDLAMLI